MDKISAIKKQFQSGKNVSLADIRPVIAQSWRRSKRAGVTVTSADRRLFSPVQVQQRIEKRLAFYRAALPMMESIYRFSKGSGFLLLLSDEEGVILCEKGDPEIIQVAEKNGLVVGGNRREDRWGTNGIGTCLVTREPIQVFGEEHYYELHADWVCSGAPIFGANGSLKGVFCLCGMREKVTDHTLGMAVATAEAITHQLEIAQAYRELEVTQSNLNLMLENQPLGVILLDKNHCIKAANRKAIQLLGCMEKISAQATENLKGMSVEEFLPGISLEAIDKNGRLISLTQEKDNRKQIIRLILSVQQIEQGKLLMFEREESMHSKINQVIGSSAHFQMRDIIGESKSLRSAKYISEIAASNNSNVLILGESGTGKELFAQAIHNASSRRNGPFVAINCGAIPKSLIESELFGYEAGSFTGAKKGGCAGKFELADHGTIFLDEIGDMPFEIQVSLLRVLQNREVTRIGSNQSIQVDVRVIAATNQDLSKKINQNLFRSDLYFRLNVFTIRIPALRERAGDVRLLADYFLRKYDRTESGCQAKRFTKEAYERMETYDWPGNVRELENMVERAVYLAKQDEIDLEDLLLAEWDSAVIGREKSSLRGIEEIEREAFGIEGLGGRGLSSENNYLSMQEAEERQIVKALNLCGNNVRKAAVQLGISRRTLYRKLEKYQIRYRSKS